MPQQPLDFSLFRPQGEAMRRETSLVRAVLLLWMLLSFGAPLLVWLAGLGDPQHLGRSMLTELRLFGFPFHYWLLAQGCTGGFVLLCKLYCTLWDRRFPPYRPDYLKDKANDRDN